MHTTNAAVKNGTRRRKKRNRQKYFSGNILEVVRYQVTWSRWQNYYLDRMSNGDLAFCTLVVGETRSSYD